ncbi:HEAT repeat domain-containing protein [Bryobacter aggregatus]|uniref:HEAT repeat domain-containing protein n=1 Tax=Bryobacter aggregatus TaxID=360054 RepID=UPI0004E21921|nr:HEAT repeat domain-containing protein [Bryobacter aggregatus]
MPIQPSAYAQTPVSTLLDEVGKGRIGFDQRLIAAIVARPEESVEALVAYGSKPAEGARLEIDADILNLLAHLPGAPAIDYIATLLREGFTELPSSMVKIAREAGAGAIEPLINAYRALEEDASGEVAFLLAGLGVHDQRIFDIILERLDFDMEDGAILLGLYGDKAGIAPLEKLLAEVGKNREIEFALEQLKHIAPEIPEPEIDFLEDYAATAGPEFEVLDDDEIVEFATSHEDEAVRLAALDVLEDLELPETAVTPLMALAAGSDTIAVRAAAFRALARLNQIAEVRSVAEATLEDSHAPAALRAASLITLLPDSVPAKKLRTYVEEFLANPSSRADGVHAMWRSREASYNTRFGAFLEDPDLAVRRQAIRGAGVCGDVTAIGKLRDLMLDDDVRKDAIFAYSMAVPSDVSPSRMRSLFKRIEKEAGGLNHDETTAVAIALDMRLEADGKEAIFLSEVEDADEHEGHQHD